MVFSRNSQTEAEPIAEQMLRRPDRPTAIFAYSDYIALGVYRTARTLGLRIPDDLSVVGFNDIAPALDVTPTLSTTVQVPFLSLGAQAARMCFADNVLNRTDLHVTFASKLVLRDSTGPAPYMPER